MFFCYFILVFVFVFIFFTKINEMSPLTVCFSRESYLVKSHEISTLKIYFYIYAFFFFFLVALWHVSSYANVLQDIKGGGIPLTI